MKTKTITRSISGRSTARAAKIAKEINSPELTALINTAWHTAYTTLWNCTQFSTAEIDNAKKAIGLFLQQYKTPEKGFIAFCQRVVLGKTQDIFLCPIDYWLPAQWFNCNIANGFALTRVRYEEIEKKRASLPMYKQELKAFAEAVLEFSQEPTVRNYKFWRQYFIDRNKPDFLELFQKVCVQQICGS
jgi:hypothetical protein